jgi:hypothetical protein
MATWANPLLDHPVWQAIDSARTAIDGGIDKFAEAGEAESAARLLRVIDYARSRLHQADTYLVQRTVIDQMESHVAAIATAVGNFVSTSDGNHVSSAHQHADSLANTASSLPVIASSADLEDIQTAAQAYRGALERQAQLAADRLATLETTINATEAAATAQADRITAQDARIDSVVTDAQSQLLTVQSEGGSAMNAAVAEVKSQVADAVTQAAQEMKQAAEDAAAEFRAIREATEASSMQALAEFRTQADDVVTQAQAETERLVASIEELEKKAIRTVGTIGRTALSGGYKLAADEEDKQANKLRLWAIIALAVASAISLAAAIGGFFFEVNWETLITKTLVAVPLLLLAGYAASESGRHRQQARIARQIELQLASIDSYLADLPEDQQAQVKQRLADRYFGYIPSRDDEPPALPGLPTT